MAAIDEKLRDRLLELTRMKYADQAKWYLNGFWTEGAEPEADSVWKFATKCIELDKRKKDGCELDEFEAHKFLESLGETLTVIQLREKLRKIDVDNNGKMALLEYLAFKYSKSIKSIVDAPQGTADPKELREAEEKLRAVQDALAELQKQLEEQKRTVDELHRQEEEYHGQIQALERKSTDASLGAVQKSKAAAELAQLKQQDPLPLRKAKLTQEAQTRKVEKAVAETENRLKEALDYLEQVKKKGGVAQGAVWWMERELKEAQKYLPKKKQTV